MEEVVKQMGYGLDDDGNLVYTAANGLVTTVCDAFGNTKVTNSAYASGQNAVNSLAAGIKSRKTYLYNTAGEVVGVIDTATKNKLEIRSPSRVMRRSGQNAGDSLALGLEDEKERVEQASCVLAGIPAAEAEKLAMRANMSIAYPSAAHAGSSVVNSDIQDVAIAFVQALVSAGLSVNMDAKTVGYLTAEHVGKKLGFDSRR